MPSSKRRVRIYPLSAASSEAMRTERRRAAAREYRLLNGVVHEGILRVELLTNAEQGPALVFEHGPDAERRAGGGLEIKGRLHDDPDVKHQAVRRWVAAVNQ